MERKLISVVLLLVGVALLVAIVVSRRRPHGVSFSAAEIRAEFHVESRQVFPAAKRASAYGYTGGRPAAARAQLDDMRLVQPLAAVAQGEMLRMTPRDRKATVARAVSLRFFADVMCVAHNTILADEATVAGRDRSDLDTRVSECADRLQGDPDP